VGEIDHPLIHEIKQAPRASHHDFRSVTERKSWWLAQGACLISWISG